MTAPTKARARRLARTCLACIGEDHGRCWGEVAIRVFMIGLVRVPCVCAKRQHLTMTPCCEPMAAYRACQAWSPAHADDCPHKQ